MTAVGCCVCANTPCDGLECGVYLPGRKPRRQPAAKSKAELSEIRSRAWATRRLKAGTADSVGTKAACRRSESQTPVHNPERAR